MNRFEEADDLFEKTFRSVTLPIGLFTPFIVDLVAGGFIFFESLRQTGVDLFEMSTHQKFDHRRDNRAREEIRGEHRENDRHGQRLKKIFGRAA